jgi:hypothetical protein
MYEDHAITHQALQDKAFAPEYARADALGESYFDFRALCGAQERVFLAQEPPKAPRLRG